MQAVTVRNLSKTFNGKHKALNNVSIDVAAGEMVALIGASGSGKSTLLRHVSGLVDGDANNPSEIRIFEQTMQSNGEIAKHARKLRSQVGVVFQQFNLVGRLKVLTNVLMGSLGTMPYLKGCLGWFSEEQKIAAMHALSRVGISAQAMQRGSPFQTDNSNALQSRALWCRVPRF